MATLQAHGGAIATAVKTEKIKWGNYTIEYRKTAALCQDGAVLVKTDNCRIGPSVASYEKRWRGGAYKVGLKKGGSNLEAFASLQASWGRAAKVP